MNDTRKERRLPVALLARYREPTMLEAREGECRDLSPGGMFIMTPRPSPRGALVRFECTSQDPEEVFRGTGRVVWQRNKSDPRGPSGMGIRFVRLESGGREILQRIVERVHLERQRARAEGDRRTSSGPPPHVRAADDAVTQAAPILTAAGNGAPPSAEPNESKSDLRQGTMRGIGAHASRSAEPTNAASSSGEPGRAPRSPLPPSPMPAAPHFSGNLGSTLLDGTPSPSGAVIAARSPFPPPLDPVGPSPLPANPGPSNLGSTIRTHVDAATSSVRSAPIASAGGSPSPSAREAIERTLRNYGAESSASGAERDLASQQAASAPTLRQNVDRSASGNPRAANERAGRLSDRPPRPGGVDDLRIRAAAPPKEGTLTAESAARDDDDVDERVAERSDREARSQEARERDRGDASDRDPSLPTEKARRRVEPALWIILGSGVVASVLLIVFFGAIPMRAKHSDKPIPRTTSELNLPARLVVAAKPAAAPRPAPSPKAPTTEPTAPLAPAPANPDVNDRSAVAPTPTAEPPMPPPVRELGSPATAPRSGATSSSAPAPKESGPRAMPPKAHASSPAIATPQTESASEPAAATPPTASEPAPSAAEPAAQLTPLKQALDCLMRGDNPCVIRALADKAQTARELELLIATYAAVGNADAAQREMKHYLERYPEGQHANEYRRVLGLQGADPNTKQSAAPEAAARH